MRNGLLAALCVASLAMAPGSADGQEAAGGDTASLEVAGAVITTSVSDRQPVDTLSMVPADVGRIYLWTRITGASGDTEVAHVWHHGDRERARVALDVSSPDWRTWSGKRILPSWTGDWRVEIVGPRDSVLATTTFVVEE